MSLKLTFEMIYRQKSNQNLSSIKKLNLWGKSLGDISIISEFKYLESATFTQNFITSLECFKNLHFLKELSLKNNLITDFREIQYLASCTNLQKLWLVGNPISNSWDYRAQIIKILPNLIVLDDQEVTEEERNGQFFEKKNQRMKYNRPPSQEQFYDKKYYMNNFEYFGKVKRDSEDIDDKNYLGILPGMVNPNDIYRRNFYNRYKSSRDGNSGKISDRYGKRGCTPFNNNYHLKDEEGKNDFSGGEKDISGCPLRKYNQMEVSSATVQGQQSILDCVSALLKGLTKDELLYIVDHIDEKISKI